MARFVLQEDGNYLDTTSADNSLLSQVDLMRTCRKHKNSSVYATDSSVSDLVVDIESVLPANWEELLDVLPV